MLSTSILSKPNGPNELFTIFAIDSAATTTSPTDTDTNKNRKKKCQNEMIDKTLDILQAQQHTILVSNLLPRNTISTKESTSSRIPLEHAHLAIVVKEGGGDRKR
jgi:hypothetical protein